MESTTLQVYFENASLDQASYLTQLALDSNAIYNYRTVTDEEALKVFAVTKNHFDNGIVCLMKSSEEILGFFGLACWKDDNDMIINSLSHLFLKPPYIGQGYGKILFLEAMRMAKEQLGWETLLWKSDPNAAWFYRMMGAKKIGETPCVLSPENKLPLFAYTL